MYAGTPPPVCRVTGVKKRRALERWFPTPSLSAPLGVGVDISDSSVKWLSLKDAKRGWEVDSFGSLPLPPGVVESGVVRDPQHLAEVLMEVEKTSGVAPLAHVSLPEETAFVFDMHVADARDREQVLHMIEFELEGRVPIRAPQALFDYDIVDVHRDGVGAEIGVTVFPVDVVEGYADAFSRARVLPISFELEARSIARAATTPGGDGVILIADFGRARTGIAIIKQQVPIFTSTVSVGGDMMTHIITDKLSVDEKKAEEFKNLHGISKEGDPKVSETIIGTAAALADEIARHYEYWDTRRNEHGERVTPVSQVLLAGGSSNLKGLKEYIASRVQSPTEHINPWHNVCSFNDYIPPIDKNHALGYATVAGLALRNL